jgi:hypothetical protein
LGSKPSGARAVWAKRALVAALRNVQTRKKQRANDRENEAWDMD